MEKKYVNHGDIGGGKDMMVEGVSSITEKVDRSYRVVLACLRGNECVRRKSVRMSVKKTRYRC